MTAVRAVVARAPLGSPVPPVQRKWQDAKRDRSALGAALLALAAFLVGDIVASAADTLGQTGCVVGMDVSVELEARTIRRSSPAVTAAAPRRPRERCVVATTVVNVTPGRFALSRRRRLGASDWARSPLIS